MVSDAALRVVVGADLLRPLAGADLGAPRGRQLGLLLLALELVQRARRTRIALTLFWSCDFSSCIATTRPVGRCVTRTAESVVFTLCPPGPVERMTSTRRSFSWISISTSSASGITATVAVDV